MRLFCSRILFIVFHWHRLQIVRRQARSFNTGQMSVATKSRRNHVRHRSRLVLYYLAIARCQYNVFHSTRFARARK